jgi:carbonic anhydrase/acetyltransferase-like protein (isoleucine patch superfamily)
MGSSKMIHLGRPEIDRSAFIDPMASVLGNVFVGEGVYVAPHASIRADEPGSCIILERGCNVQDNVVIHALRDSTVRVGMESTLAHGCIVHGPCSIGERCFVGFGSVLFHCILDDESAVMHRALVTHATIPRARMVVSGAVIENALGTTGLPEVAADTRKFIESAQDVNIQLAKSYNSLASAPRPWTR